MRSLSGGTFGQADSSAFFHTVPEMPRQQDLRTALDTRTCDPREAGQAAIPLFADFAGNCATVLVLRAAVLVVLSWLSPALASMLCLNLIYFNLI